MKIILFRILLNFPLQNRFSELSDSSYNLVFFLPLELQKGRESIFVFIEKPGRQQGCWAIKSHTDLVESISRIYLIAHYTTICKTVWLSITIV